MSSTELTTIHVADGALVPTSEPTVDEKQMEDEIITQGKICLLLSHASKNNIEGMLELFNKGVSPDDADYDKRTALHLACSDGSLEAVQLLLEKGAEVNPIDRFGKTPLDDALDREQDEITAKITEMLKENDAAFGSREKMQGDLITFAATGQHKEAEKLLQSGLSPNACDYDNRTALHLAVAENDHEMAGLLLKHEANPYAEDRFGLTPIADMHRRAVRTGADPMKAVFMQYVKQEERVNPCSTFLQLFTFLQVIFIVLFFTCTDYGDEAEGTAEGANGIKGLYPWFQDIHVMIFIGFGFLMTFLRKNAFSALGWTFMISTFCIEWYILAGSLFEMVIVEEAVHKIKLDLTKLIFGDFSAGAVLISYGAVLGKVSPFQFVLIALIEVVIYSINEAIGIKMGIHDLGGSMVIHMFGAYFGMGLSTFMAKKNVRTNTKDNASVYHSDLFAMIGTIFLWMYWPSFNAGLSENDFQQQRAVVNTVLSLVGSCFASFLASYYFRKERKFNMVDIQNATLAGGVAMGTCCDLMIGPGAALLIGCLSGVLSVVGYVHVQPALERSMGYLDTCGVHNLHGMPSVLGALAGVIAAAAIKEDEYSSDQLGAIYAKVKAGDHSIKDQALLQLAYIGVTLGLSFVGGAITGLFVKQACFEEAYESETAFSDALFWEVPDLEIPYYFDRRGEIASHGAEQTAHDGNVQVQDKNAEAKIKVLESGLADLKKRVNNHRNTTVGGLGGAPYFYGAPPAASGGDMELKLMVSKLINKVDEQAAFMNRQSSSSSKSS